MKARKRRKAVRSRHRLFLLAAAATLFAFAGFQAYDLIIADIPAAARRDIVIPEVPGSPLRPESDAETMQAAAHDETPRYRASETDYGEEEITGEKGEEILSGLYLSGLRVDTASDYLGDPSGRDPMGSALSTDEGKKLFSPIAIASERAVFPTPAETAGK
ncbi:MAG: hypothetical protein K8I29_16445 [Alphaproteobacteria bacterium]|uniref:Uncharacterized protein n=1 Tax=Candidatus Nitrobium versatile TaxID=2884831 RepID=A0A953M2K0_9BACT|nr:hypothetical protein [Candidatus Nitrobium versatile]